MIPTLLGYLAGILAYTILGPWVLLWYLFDRLRRLWV